MPTAPVGPPTYTVNVDKPSGDKGDVFYTTGPSAAAVGLSIPAVDQALANVQPSTLVIADKSGKVLWQHAAAKGNLVADFRTQTYQGHKVITWWEGSDEGGHGSGAAYIANSSYKIIKKIEPPGAVQRGRPRVPAHPGRRALITCYHDVTHDMSSIDGPKQAQMNDGLAFVVDVDRARCSRSGTRSPTSRSPTPALASRCPDRRRTTRTTSTRSRSIPRATW